MNLSQASWLNGFSKNFWLLCLIEMLSRLSYHGVRSILIIYLIDRVGHGGLNWSSPEALRYFGVFIGLFVSSTVIGGYACDHLIGYDRGLQVGLSILAIGYAILLGSTETGNDLSTSLRSILLWAATITLACGNALYQPSAMVHFAEVFSPNNPKRENCYMYYSQAGGAGSLLGSLIVGSLGELFDWRLGFGAALVSIACAAIVPRAFHSKIRRGRVETQADLSPSASEDWVAPGGLVILIVLGAGAFLFSVCLEQFKGLMMIVAQDHIERDIGLIVLPVSWIPGMLDIIELLTIPVMLWVLEKAQQNGHNLSVVSRFSLGFTFVALSLLLIVVAAEFSGNAKIPFLWVFVAYLMLGQGENLLWPSGYSAASKLANPARRGVVLGLWLFVTSALGMATGGYVGGQIGTLGLVPGMSVLAIACFVGIAMLLVMRRAMRPISNLPGREVLRSLL